MIKNLLKQNWGKVILSIISIAYSFVDIFFLVLLIYGWIIYFLVKKRLPEKVRFTLSIFIWTGFILVTGMIFYVNHYLPHGPSYPTGDIVCQNDDRGPCREEYKEDLRGLNIPNWAKFLRGSEGWGLVIGLLIAGGVISKDKS